jgi:alpha-beta hydrolase superfamily lysophospholipase
VPAVDPEVVARSKALGVSFESADGTPLHAYVVPPVDNDPLVTVVLVHGLFRNAMELETVGAMFRRGGAEVCLLELRSHGGSGDALFTFGLRESEDVEAAVDFLRSRPGREDDSVVLFGVSLGTAAVALAAPRIPNLAGVVLDAPMDDLLSAAHRMLSETQGRVVGISEPFRSLVIRGIELWSGYRMSEVRPIDALASLPADLPILLIGAGLDHRMPPDSVTGIYDSLQAQPGVKELWFCEQARHGHVWEEDPEGYEERIARFIPRTRDG